MSMVKELSNVHDDSVMSLAFSKSDGNKLISYSADGTLKLVDVRMEKVVMKYDDNDLLSAGSYGNVKV